MENGKPIIPPVLVNQGIRVKASYKESEIPAYEGNPLISALPSILTEEQAGRQMAYFPAYDEKHRDLPNHLRFHLIQCGLKFFTPLPVHLDLERRFSCLIRGGYIGRNPMNASFFPETEEKLGDLRRGEFKPNYVWSTCAGFSIIGMSGMGKTRSVESILNLYPQVIYHQKYNERDFTQGQIVWLKLDCPYDSNPRAVCINFFQQVDNILGTNFRKIFGKERRLVDEMMLDMANVAAQHFLGVLVVDEIQRLSRAKSGGSGKLLDFFVQLINTIGVPVVLVGTYKALSILSREFSQIRRGTGQGDLIWDRMEEDRIWELFVKSLWKYQYTRKDCPLDKNTHLAHILYEETQGITDFAVKVYMLAQVRAITSGRETITAGIIRSVAKDSLRTAARVLEALRKRDNKVLEEYDDIPFIDFDSYWEKAIKHRGESLAPLVPLSAGGVTDTALLPTENHLPQESAEGVRGKISSSEIAKGSRPERPANRKPYMIDGTLPKVAADGIRRGLTAYEAFQQAGYTRSCNEYL